MTLPFAPLPRLRNPVKCALCGTVWKRREQLQPSCSHTDEEWDTHYKKHAAEPPELGRRHWLPYDEPQEAKAS